MTDGMPRNYKINPGINDDTNIGHLYKWENPDKKFARHIYIGFSNLVDAKAVSVELTGKEASRQNPGFHVKVNQQVFDKTEMSDNTAEMMRWVMAQSWCTVSKEPAVETSQVVVVPTAAETRQVVIPAAAETSQVVVPAAAETSQAVIPAAATTNQVVASAETVILAETNQAISAGSSVDQLAAAKTTEIISQMDQALAQQKAAELRVIAAEARKAEAQARLLERQAVELEKAVSEQEAMDRAALNTKQALSKLPVPQFDTPQSDLLMRHFALRISEASAGCKRKRDESGDGASLESNSSSFKAPLESSGSKALIESSSSSPKAPLQSSGAAPDNKGEGASPEAERKSANTEAERKSANTEAERKSANTEAERKPKVQRTTDSFLSAQSIIDAVEPSMQSFIEATEPLNRAISAFAASFFRMQPGP